MWELRGHAFKPNTSNILDLLRRGESHRRVKFELITDKFLIIDQSILFHTLGLCLNFCICMVEFQ